MKYYCTILLIMMLLLTSEMYTYAEVSIQFIDTVKSGSIKSSKPNDSINWKRLTPVIISGAALYAGSMTGLYMTWYSNYPQSAFHFFNDNNEYLQMDKVGHFTTTYNISRLSYNTLRWTGLTEKQSVLYGGGMGIMYLTIVEILDGFSAEWGFSPGDMTGNTLGATLFVGEQLLWKEQRLQMKWSYHQTIYPQYRPDLFGKSTATQWLKDYNGQTYWISTNIKSFLSKESKFPAWLNLAVGYGAEGMTGAAYNSLSYNGKVIPPYNRYRQFYLSGDIDLSRIKTRSKTLHMILNALSFIKIPFPALEFSQGKIVTHAFYF